jgi:hypothetical protein
MTAKGRSFGNGPRPGALRGGPRYRSPHRPARGGERRGLRRPRVVEQPGARALREEEIARPPASRGTALPADRFPFHHLPPTPFADTPSERAPVRLRGGAMEASGRVRPLPQRRLRLRVAGAMPLAKWKPGPSSPGTAARIQVLMVSIGGSGRLLRWREELGECFSERLGMGQRGGVAGAGDLVHPCGRDVVGHVQRAGPVEGDAVHGQHQHRS